MKKWICAAASAAFCLLIPVAVLAEETSEDGRTETTTSSVSSSVTETTTSSTSSQTTTTETAAKPVLSTHIELSINDNQLVALVTDENGNEAPNAPLVFEVDGNVYAPQKTNARGRLFLSLAATPKKVVCTLENYEVSGQRYTGTVATLNLGPIVTDPPPTVHTTVNPQTTTTTTTIAKTSAKTQVRTSSTPTYPSYDTDTSSEATTGGEGAISDSSTTTEASGDGKVDMRPVSGWAIAIIVIGVLLLIGAGLMVYFFLIRKPKDDELEEEADMPVTGNDEESGSEEAGETEESISLDSLFQKDDEDGSK